MAGQRGSTRKTQHQGEGLSIYLTFPEIARIDKLAREMRWKRSRTINALIAAVVPETREARKALAEALIAADKASYGRP